MTTGLLDIQAGREERYKLWLKDCTEIATRHGISPAALMAILEDPDWRDLYMWAETKEFINRLVYNNKSYVKGGD